MPFASVKRFHASMTMNKSSYFTLHKIHEKSFKNQILSKQKKINKKDRSGNYTLLKYKMNLCFVYDHELYIPSNLG